MYLQECFAVSPCWRQPPPPWPDPPKCATPHGHPYVPSLLARNLPLYHFLCGSHQYVRYPTWQNSHNACAKFDSAICGVVAKVLAFMPTTMAKPRMCCGACLLQAAGYLLIGGFGVIDPLRTLFFRPHSTWHASHHTSTSRKIGPLPICWDRAPAHPGNPETSGGGLLIVETLSMLCTHAVECCSML